MKIDYGFILAAGMGTRMGKIGKVLPKPLWPIGFKKLIDIPISQMREIGIKKIYINTHHCHREIETYLDKDEYSDVELVYEEELLGSGGGVLNIIDKVKKGNLLILNSDMFLNYNLKNWINAWDICNSRISLLCMRIKKGDSFSNVMIENNTLKQINNGQTDITFSGASILRMDSYNIKLGCSNFFDVIAPYKSEKVSAYLDDKLNYYDFGTKLSYYKSHFDLKNDDEAKNWLENNGLWADGFVCHRSKTINYSGEKSNLKNSILLTAGTTSSEGIIYKDLLDDIN